MLMKKILIDKNKCIGCGLCSAFDPKTFKLGKNGKAEIVNQKRDSDGKIKEAIGSCPTGAIEFVS
jgi:ferredoxin